MIITLRIPCWCTRWTAILFAKRATGIITRSRPACTRPENVDLRAVQEVQKCLALVGQLEAAQAVAAPESGGTEGGLPADFVEQIRSAMSMSVGG
jgi:hypothetical protein